MQTPEAPRPKRSLLGTFDSLVVRFVLAGAGGALLSLVITWSLTTFVVGTEHYFAAYVVGIATNLLFNFIVYTIAVFKTTRDHLRRLAVFFLYGVIMAFLQGSTVALITNYVGLEWYLLVIAGVIASFAVLNFFVFKLSIFKELAPGERMPTRELIAFIILCGVLLRLAVLFHVLSLAGVAPLIYGDAIGYRSLAENIATGNGFVSMRAGEFQPEVFRTPGLPLLLAPFASTDVGLAWYLSFLAVIAGILLPLLAFDVARRLLPTFGAVAVVALVSFEPHLIFFSFLPLSEMPFMLTAYGGLSAFFAAYDRRSILFAVFAGSLFGYAALIRPGFLPIFVVTTLVLLAYYVCTDRARVRYALVTVIAVFVILMPWYVRMHEVTGVYALGGAGWRNVYTDYLGSLNAIERHTGFDVEKHYLMDHSQEIAGVAPELVENPASAEKLRTYALAELWRKRSAVMVFEPTLLFSFFTQDGYYYAFRRYLLVPNDAGTAHTSATFALLSKGVSGIQDVLAETSRQLFIPIVGRVFTVLVFFGALIGFFAVGSRLRYPFALVIALSALTATAIGLGVESRLRLPVEPLLFIFFVAGCYWVTKFIPSRHAH